MGSVAKVALPTFIEFVKRDRPTDITTPDYDLNALAAQCLGEIGSNEAVPCLIEALGDKNYLCTCAAGALGKIGDERSVQPLINVLKDNTKFWVPRGAAANALGNLGSLAESALPDLKQALEFDVDKNEKWDIRAREAVEDAIHRIKNPNEKSKLKDQGARYEMWGIY